MVGQTWLLVLMLTGFTEHCFVQSFIQHTSALEPHLTLVRQV